MGGRGGWALRWARVHRTTAREGGGGWQRSLAGVAGAGGCDGGGRHPVTAHPRSGARRLGPAAVACRHA